MKKTLFLAFTLLLAIPLFSQVDTLQMNQYEPTYYYWGDHWYTYYGNPVPTVLFPGEGPSMIIARRCYVDTFLRVIGVAAPSAILIPLPDSHYSKIKDTTTTNRMPEYFQIYEAEDTGMRLMAEARWDTNHPRHCMWLPPVHQLQWVDTVSQIPYVYEAYFENPVVVRDSFYVAATTYNNDFFFNSQTGHYEGYYYYQMTYFFTSSRTPGSNDVYKARLTNPMELDTNPDATTRMLQEWYDSGWFYVPAIDMGRFMALFPIFDTSSVVIQGHSCDSVRDLRISMADGNAYVYWCADTSVIWWELSYGAPGVQPEDGTRDTFGTSLACLSSLPPGRQYDVYVRGCCQNDMCGPWTGPLSFTMAGSSDVTSPSQSIVDRHTHVMPNPTGGMTSVVSGFKISTIEVYNTAGSLVMTFKINANTGAIDVTNLPLGTYILRIHTTHGATTQRLVKS